MNEAEKKLALKRYNKTMSEMATARALDSMNKYGINTAFQSFYTFNDLLVKLKLMKIKVIRWLIKMGIIKYSSVN